ncbi:MAG TPA: hypothetical protein VFY38_10615, partial [Pseudonocardia sp.]|nr:hypothetical protein [Pseudonocardia sp.]
GVDVLVDARPERTVNGAGPARAASPFTGGSVPGVALPGTDGSTLREGSLREGTLRKGAV